MILAIDIGNTNITFGCLSEKGRISHIGRVRTDRRASVDEYAASLKNILELNGAQLSQVRGSIITSVVPQLTATLAKAAEKISDTVPIIVSPGIKTGLNLLVDNPAQVGSDRVVDAVAAYHYYKGPVAVIDMGTATTVSVVDKNGSFLGGLIMPGVRSSLEALSGNAAQLPHVSVENCKRFIGKNTVESMQSGILNGHAAMVDGLAARLRREMGEELKIIATGGFSRLVLTQTKEDIIHDENLILKGLYLLYCKNSK
ncbi:MAG: type III pantothenate kinase [Oscillospiraceae bacterium]|nr:type III pantothenate kinase [Oscillospiraceae bacterium]